MSVYSGGVQTFDGRRPEISYPCSWTYRIICTDEASLRTSVATLVPASAYTLKPVGESPTGRYQRLELVVEVRDETQRNEIFAGLGKLAMVRFVL